MPDTRKQFPVGQGIPGFKAGQGLFNQTRQTPVQTESYQWNLHATIHQLTQGDTRRVQGFHVSLYSDNKKSWGRFIWSYSGAGIDRFDCKGFEGGKIADLGNPADRSALQKKATQIAQALRKTIGSSAINEATYSRPMAR